MNRLASDIFPPPGDTGALDDSVSLRIVTSADRAAGENADPQMLAGRQRHCLLCLVPLGSPRVRSSRARRLRLKDSLAGNSPAQSACILAREPLFWDYLQQFNLIAYDAEIDCRRARHFINRVCNVNGRHELNRQVVAGQRFFELIERPFLAWLLADAG